MNKIITTQFIVLLAGTIFAWCNFTYELINWLNTKSCTSCGSFSIVPNPFYTACFFGAIFFTIAFILNIILLKKSK